jgi:hypothetical protein
VTTATGPSVVLPAQPRPAQQQVIAAVPETPIVNKQGELLTAPVAVPGTGKAVLSPSVIVPSTQQPAAPLAQQPGAHEPAAPTLPASQPGTAQQTPLLPAGATALVYTLVDQVCVDFNTGAEWASRRINEPSDVWTDWFAGWAPFAVDEGFYQAENVTFSLERVVGPGIDYGPNQHAAKIASNQPYAAGFGSPLIHVRPGSVVIVSVNYLIFDHDTHGDDLDWASLGIKPDATREGASYVNGFTRGRWATMTHSLVAGPTGEIMVLIQAHSPASLNSNIYFDNVRIWVDGIAVQDCRYE